MFRRGLCLVLVLIVMDPSSWAQQVYIKDTPADTGVEPNPDTGPMWVSDDIWVRTSADPGYQPSPFAEASPPWTPLPHQNPEYRDPKYDVPNYVYVRVRNHSNSASSGTERLRLYWAKASTGLSWPTQWVDYMANNCGPTKLYGMEITKPRQNAATATAAEQNAYRDAILTMGTNPAYVFFGGTDYWHKQNEVHSLGPANRHGTAAFLPWHRDFVNRYEVLLQEVNPTVKLLYWDWTTDPRTSTGGFNLDTTSFMGNSGAGTGGVSIGPPFINPGPPTLAPPSVVRDLGGNPFAPTPTSAADTTVLGKSPFPTFHPFIEGTPHNYSHVYIGGAGGDMSSIPTAAKDPFFFLLHANVDRLWAQWQRDPSNLARLDPATVYDTETTNVNITTSLAPWDGTGTPIQPWTAAGGYIVTKLPTDPAIVSPPIYDTAPLTIPVLQPNQAVVIQVPWYPPNPADFSCFGADQGHFCLLARIETSNSPPFGMTFPETADVYTNTKNNNKIAWKNLTVVDNFPGPLVHASILVRNVFDQRVQAGLRLRESQKFGGTVLDKGRLFLDLKPELFKRWREGQGAGTGVKIVEERQPTTRLQIESPEASIHNITLEPKEAFPVDVYFELPKDYTVRQGAFAEFDLVQVGAPGKPEAIVGGQRFVFDLTKLVIIKAGDEWRFREDGALPGQSWTAPGFDDSKWRLGKADLGFGISGPGDQKPARRNLTTYFRHTFEIADPTFYRSLTLLLKHSGGVVVYANGKEVHRANLPSGAIAARQAANRAVTGLEKTVFFPFKLDPALLVRGRNVVAVEVHQNPRGGNPDFDLELQANRADSGFPPALAVASPPEAALFQPGENVQVMVEAIAPDGNVRSVSLYDNSKLVGTAEKPPYSFKWTAGEKGLHRLRAEVVDNNQRKSTAFRSLSVVGAVPPAVTLLTPGNGAEVRRGSAISVSAQASDRNGKIREVEFWVREADFFMSKANLASTLRAAPYRATIKDLKPGHYMVWAVAVNDRGASSQSMPVHVMIR